MYTVDLYLRVRLACHVDGLSQREAASRFGIGDGMAADDPSNDRVEAEPVGIGHVVIPAKASENGLRNCPTRP